MALDTHILRETLDLSVQDDSVTINVTGSATLIATVSGLDASGGAAVVGEVSLDGSNWYIVYPSSDPLWGWREQLDQDTFGRFNVLGMQFFRLRVLFTGTGTLTAHFSVTDLTAQHTMLPMDASGSLGAVGQDGSVYIIGNGGRVGTVSVAFAALMPTLTRPANTTAYTAGDSISNSATAASVTALGQLVAYATDPWAVQEINALILSTNDTGVATKQVRAWLYNSDPTANSGVQAGDNAAYSNKRAGFVGTLVGTMKAMQDGSVGRLVPEDTGNNPLLVEAKYTVGFGGYGLWVQYQSVDGFTPSANSTQFVGRLLGKTYQAYNTADG